MLEDIKIACRRGKVPMSVWYVWYTIQRIKNAW